MRIWRVATGEALGVRGRFFDTHRGVMLREVLGILFAICQKFLSCRRCHICPHNPNQERPGLELPLPPPPEELPPEPLRPTDRGSADILDSNIDLNNIGNYGQI